MTRLRGTLLALVVAPAAAFAQTPPAGTTTSPNDPTPIPDPATNPNDPQNTPPAPVVTDPAPVTIPNDQPTYSASDRTYHTTTTESRGWLYDSGFAVSLGGGVSGFTSDSAREATNDGGGWDVRVTMGAKMPLAVELSYLGSAQSINALGIDDSAVLVGNGAQADLRLNFLQRGNVQPFVFGGAAWRRYDLTNTDKNTSDISGTDDVLELPVGAGIAFKTAGLLIDVRGEFRYATNNDLLPALTDTGATGSQADLHRYGVNANVGYEF